MSSSTQPSEEKEEKTTISSSPLQEEHNEKAQEEDTECDDLSSRSSSYRLYIATSVAVFVAICSVAQMDALSSFAEVFSSSLCDTSSLDILAEESNTTTSPDFGLSSKFDPILKDGEKYNALSAIHSRHEEIQKFCHLYADRMRPESKATTQKPTDQSAFVYYPTKSFAVCTIPGIATEGIKSLLSKGDSNVDQNRKDFRYAYPKIMESLKKVILVRHPMERLVSVYRNTFGPKMEGNTKVEAKASFREFINIVVNGYYELEVYLDQNDMKGKSLGVDTGMIDGVTGVSRKWNSYWEICGVCNLHFKPQYILHMEHVQEDFKGMADVLMEQDNLPDAQKAEIKSFLDTIHPIKSRDPATLEMYYSQLTKNDIRKIYEKYRLDHDLFGFTPDYFIKFGRGV